MLELLAPLLAVVAVVLIITAAGLSAATKIISRRLFPDRIGFSCGTLIRVTMAEVLILTGALIVTLIPLANHATPQSTGPRSATIMIIASITILHMLFALIPNRFLVRATGGDPMAIPALLGLLTPLYLTSFVVAFCILYG